MKLTPKYERLEKIAQMATKAHSKELAPGPKPEITMGMVIEVLKAAEKLDTSAKRKQVTAECNHAFARMVDDTGLDIKFCIFCEKKQETK